MLNVYNRKIVHYLEKNLSAYNTCRFSGKRDGVFGFGSVLMKSPICKNFAKFLKISLICRKLCILEEEYWSGVAKNTISEILHKYFLVIYELLAI